MSDADGLPLVVQITPANVPDQNQLPKLLKARPAVQSPRGRPRRNPEALLGDRAYGTKAMIDLVKGMRIDCALAPRTSTTHGSGLGKIRYVVERSLAWFSHFRRIRLCYERSGERFQAFHDLAASLMLCPRIKRLRLSL